MSSKENCVIKVNKVTFPHRSRNSKKSFVEEMKTFSDGSKNTIYTFTSHIFTKDGQNKTELKEIIGKVPIEGQITQDLIGEHTEHTYDQMKGTRDFIIKVNRLKHKEHKINQELTWNRTCNMKERGEKVNLDDTTKKLIKLSYLKIFYKNDNHLKILKPPGNYLRLSNPKKIDCQKNRSVVLSRNVLPNPLPKFPSLKKKNIFHQNVFQKPTLYQNLKIFKN